MRRERACGQGSRSPMHSSSFSCQRMNWSRPSILYAAARAFDDLPRVRCLILATEQLCTNRGGCQQHSSRRRSFRETVHISRKPVMFICRSDKRFKEGRSTNFAPVSSDPGHRERNIISAAGNNSSLSRHFITECQIREDSGRSISCFRRIS
jgi:hypothetical protein